MTDSAGREVQEDWEGELPGEQISLLLILAMLLRERRFILVCTAVSFVIALIFALFKGQTYTSSFSFLPQQAQDPSRAGLTSLAGQLGFSIGGTAAGGPSSQLYADMLKSREVLLPIAVDSFIIAPKGERISLAEFFDISGSNRPIVLEKTLRKLRTMVTPSVATRTTGVVSVTVATKSPRVSLEIAQRLVNGLNVFYLGTRRTQASEERRFTEARLAEARVSLRIAENAQERFLLVNRQFSGSPQLAFQQDRLQREVALRQQLVNGLAQSFEEARIREVRDTPVITVLERPTLAAQPEPRGRIVILVAGTLLGIFLGSVAALTRNMFRRLRKDEDPAFAELMHAWRQSRLEPLRASAGD